MNGWRFNKRSVTVVGLGRSGTAACELLHRHGASVRATELRSARDLPAGQVINSCYDIPVEWNGHTTDSLEGAEWVVVSPGVDPRAMPLQWATEHDVPVLGELELAAQVCRAPVIAITGTNGKTTTTLLIGQLLAAAGQEVEVCGNIGRPFSKVADQVGPHSVVVLETSSFQLEGVHTFRPWVSVILNLEDDHLDRHGDVESYWALKARIFERQGPRDWTVLNALDPHVAGMASQTRARVRFFAEDDELDANQAAACAVGSILGFDYSWMRRQVQTFQRPDHRMSQVGDFGGVRVINDSKSTNPASTAWALRHVDRPTVLLMGGRDKDMDFRRVRRVTEQVVALVVFGEARYDIAAALCGVAPIIQTDSFEQAVEYGWRLTQPGDCLLCSPGCASFDAFEDYQHRGERFCDLVRMAAAREGE